jgi:hypothetical protein
MAAGSPSSIRRVAVRGYNLIRDVVRPVRQNNFKPHFGRTTLIVFYLIGATLRDILGR